MTRYLRTDAVVSIASMTMIPRDRAVALSRELCTPILFAAIARELLARRGETRLRQKRVCPADYELLQLYLRRGSSCRAGPRDKEYCARRRAAGLLLLQSR